MYKSSVLAILPIFPPIKHSHGLHTTPISTLASQHELQEPVPLPQPHGRSRHPQRHSFTSHTRQSVPVPLLRRLPPG